MHISASGPAFSDVTNGSAMVTTASQDAALPLASVAVPVTVTGPRSAQVKAERLSVTPAIAQLSAGADTNTSDGAIVALPEASRLTVMFLQFTTGISASVTVTVKLQVETIPSASVDV